MKTSTLPRRRLLITFLVFCTSMSMNACVQDKHVDAPVVELSIPRLGADASAPIAIGGPATATPPHQSRNNGTMEGRWEGTGYQNDGMSWPMVVEISSSTMSGVCATVDYPSIPCRAEWICTNGDPSHAAKNVPIEAIERLLGDSSLRCIDNGTMHMHLLEDGGSILWSWQGQGLTAASQLHRVD